MELNAMEVDSYEPPCFKTGGPLRRSSSLPSVYTDSSRSSSSTSSDDISIFEPCGRVRRYSTNLSDSSGINNNVGKMSERVSSVPIKIPSRVTQIKQEEKADINRRESLHEKEVTASFQLSHSWEEFNISESSNNRCDKSLGKFAEPLTIFPSTLPLSASPSPSPTRITGKQCYSPSMQMPIRGNSLTPSPTPSPTRRTFTSRRSMSPITIRPSVLATTLKRKLGEGDVEMSPSKRYATVDNIPFSSHPHSSSDSSIEDPSPLTLTVPSGAVSTITTSTSTTTTNSTSCFNIFKPVTSQNS